MAIRVREEKPKSVKEALKMADNHELAWKAEGGGVQQLEPPKPVVPAPSKLSGSLGHPNSKPVVGSSSEE